MSHYDKQLAELEKERMDFKKKQLAVAIELMTDDEIKYMLKIATNLKEYQKFESTMRSLFGTKPRSTD